MTSWAAVAKGGGLPRPPGNEISRVASKASGKAPQNPIPAATTEPTESRVLSSAQLVAVPNIPVRLKASAVVSMPPPPITSSSTYSTVKNIPTPDTSSTITASTRASTDQSSPPRKESPPGEVTWEYALYAAPFIPAAWRAINAEAPVRIINTRNRRRIDISAYTTKFAGTAFLPEQVDQFRDGTSDPSTSTEVTPTSYQHYFTSLWRREHIAMAREMDSHALFKANLIPSPTRLEDPIWALSIPGLREDSPFLEMGDILQIRELRLDEKGDIFMQPMLVDEPDYGQGFPNYRSGWTGIQYNTCIYGINRATEMVYLKIEGLMPLFVGYHQVPSVVNVTFPLKHARLQIQQRALLSISSELEATEPRRHLAQPGFEEQEEFNHFNRTIKPTDHANTATNGANVDKNDWIRRMLFPTSTDGFLQTKLRKVPHRNLFDHDINYEQAHAVNSVCINDYGTLPYLISGPPGTGKTKTLVETAMQLYHTADVAHTLICAPSEAAADTLALRLKQYLGVDQLLRLIRPGRADNEVPRELTQYCYMEDDMYTLPPIKAMMSYNVVVTSCQDAGILVEARLTNNDLWTLETNMFATFHPQDEAYIPILHWGALIIDEAAQATEIDILPALRVALPPSTYHSSHPQPLFVMAGDENQLGPRTASRDPLFSQSLFARLSSLPLYATHPLSRSHTKPSASPPVLKKSMLPMPFPPFANLIRNYRSHPAILSVPSALFYHDTLIPEAPTPTTSLQNHLWRGRNWPVLFIPNIKPDEIERDGGGWYNLSEAHIACTIAQSLVEHSAVQQADICIMSPFAAQVKLLRLLIRSSRFGSGSGLWNVNIGPLEAFQGLERRVVIICTTRTRERFLDEDEKRGLGIIHAKRKMNVALTRAKEGLVVIGNPEVLMRDSGWREWLGFCWRNGLVGDGQEPGLDGGLNKWQEEFKKQKIGVLERALIAKEESGGIKAGKTLGGAARTLDMSRDYEVWMEKLREVMDEDEEDEEDDKEEY